ncbi:LLM class flavin-dependent oxidoreductase [Yinghuangia seranimata]|uniref:LLM class flavin-dependent oxidoreductase n=1 Tax=Yinghuangia seranimata TaxID=408067 RepID=UPI00248C8656|nr:LLM class flavin-dependent oxidoreductase [Yinghuangia seranimata]MDI2127569.1 LLM class flavin-dependent oxidoreductase [Yinghuangia seranimata]
MRFATGTTVKDFADYAAWLEVAVDCGFAMLTTGDSQSLWADPYVSLAFAAQRTTTQRLAITVSNPMTRHPAVAASAASALQHMSGGRFVLGLSSGDSALRNIGVRPAKVAETEEYVAAVRGLTRGETVTWQGAELVQRWAPGPTPVWMAAEGPRTLRAAGRIADGVVLSNSLTREAYERNLGHVAAGAAEAGRDLADIEVWCMANVVPAATEAEGIAQVRSVLAGTANHVFRFTTEGKGLPDHLVPRIEELKRRYDSRHHASPETAAHNAALVDELGLTAWLAAHSTVAGPIGRCAERLAEIAEYGVRNVIVAQFVPDQLGFMRVFADEVVGRLS